MSIFSIFQKKPAFSAAVNARVVEAIRQAELKTSGEIRVYVESKNPLMDTVERAKEVFYQLGMQQTANRNAVLLYIAMKHRELALYADEGIYEKTEPSYWAHAVEGMLAHFREEKFKEGIIHCIDKIGETLKEKFPYDAASDINELPNDIVFGD